MLKYKVFTQAQDLQQFVNERMLEVKGICNCGTKNDYLLFYTGDETVVNEIVGKYPALEKENERLKREVEALKQLRTQLDLKIAELSPQGPTCGVSQQQDPKVKSITNQDNPNLNKT